MIKTKEELSVRINEILNQSNDVKTLEEAALLRVRLAENLASAIDEYTQFQIGKRLEGILLAVRTQATDPDLSALVKASGFDDLIRKS